MLGCWLGAAAVETGVELGRNHNGGGGGGMTGLPLPVAGQLGRAEPSDRVATAGRRSGPQRRPRHLAAVGPAASGDGGFGSGGPTRGGLTPS